MATTSYDYTDEFSKQLARKRRLAELLQQQSMSGLQLANPHARASWVNALVPLAQAWAGKSMTDEAATEGTAHEQAMADKTNAAIAEAFGTPAHPDMNLPGDLSALAAPPPSAPTTRPSTDTGSPLLPPSQQPQNPMAQLLMGQNGPSLGAQMTQDQGPPLVPQLGEIGQQAAAAPPLVPNDPTRMNFSGTPAQQAALEKMAQADMAKNGLDPNNVVRGPAPQEIPPMPPQGPTPPPTLAGPPPPGALAPPPDQAPPPLIPQPPGQPDMAPKGMMLPAQPGTLGANPTAFDMLRFGGKLPPGQQQQRFMDEALKSTLTEPDRRLAKQELDQRRRDENLTRERLGLAGITSKAETAAAAEKGKTERTGMIVTGANTRTGETNASRERIAATRAAGVGLPDQSPEQRAATAAMVRAGVPLSQVVPGWGTAGTLARQQARSDAIQQLMDEKHLTPEQAGYELANNEIDYLAGRRSTTQLNTMLGATRPAVAQLEFNIGKATEEMDKLPSSDLSPIINAIARGAEKWTGDPAYSSLFFYMNAAGMESARIMQGGQASIAQLHQGAAEQAKNWANVNMTPASWKEGVAPAMLAEGKNRIETYEEAKKAQKISSGSPGGAAPAAPSATPAVNSKGWKLMTDKNGNKAYVSPDGKQYEEVK